MSVGGLILTASEARRAASISALARWSCWGRSDMPLLALAGAPAAFGQFNESFEDCLVAAFGDADFYAMRPSTMSARVRKLTFNHAIAPHVAVQKASRGASVHSAADAVPMQPIHVGEPVGGNLPIVPLPTHIDCLLVAILDFGIAG